MARTKKNSLKQFIGRRKRSSMRRTKTTLLEKSSQDAEELSLRTVKPHVAASTSKLGIFGISLPQLERNTVSEDESNDDCYVIVQTTSLCKFFSKLLCPTCKQPSISFEVMKDKTMGFAAKARSYCTACENNVSEDFLCKRVDDSASSNVPFEVNMQAVLAFRGIGCGFTAIREWCGIMNMPYHLSQNGYASIHERLNSASKSSFKDIQKKSIEAIFSAYAETGVLPDANGVLDVAVSFDGAWQRRGHSSHNGVASVIDLITGLPIDYEVLCNFCFKCQANEENEDCAWKEKHRLSCPKNFDGSSNAMEVECALRLWNRSESEYKLRYTTMLCDGDSKAHDAVQKSKVYGPCTNIMKEDCTNHVSKRMGTALRNLIAVSKAQKESLSGKGKLTQEKITKIQNYYGRAIKDYSNDITLLKRRIFAILLHFSSSDEHPKHVHCPTGEKSWCFWQRAIAASNDPGSHKEHETLPSDIGRRLVPIFQRLSEDNLLKRCVRNKTQNPNESLHSTIWKYCPKAIFVGRKTMETAVALAVCRFSMGSSFQQTLCRIVGIQSGSILKQANAEKDSQRLLLAEKKHTKSWKKRRRALKYKSSKHNQEMKVKEGETYAAGSFL